MSDKQIKIITRAAVLFLILSVAFCITAIYMSKNKSSQTSAVPQIPQVTQIPLQTEEPVITLPPQTEEPEYKKVIVIDAGHGKSSSEMSNEEKEAEGFTKASNGWGEWRHYKSGTFGESCEGSGCSGYKCWYPIGNGDRSTEPELNLNNALAARDYLEQMGYEVRLTHETNDVNQSMNKRVSYCFPNNDITAEPDADVFICLHSNAGGGRGTSYIQLSGEYTQAYIGADYVQKSNRLGEIINSKVAAASGLRENSPIDMSYLILFNKCPVPIAYLEIGFFDSASDLAILESSSDAIGQAIAEGVDEYFKE